MTKIHRIAGLAAILAAGSVLAAGSASAEPQVIRALSFSDINLQNPDGVAQLERRIERSARAMCVVNPALSSAALDEMRARCISETVASTRASVEQAIRAQRARMTQTASAQR